MRMDLEVADFRLDRVRSNIMLFSKTKGYRDGSKFTQSGHMMHIVLDECKT